MPRRALSEEEPRVMKHTVRNGLFAVAALGLALLLAGPAMGAVIYNNLTPNNLMAVATRPDTFAFEIEAGDAFVLGSRTGINAASFVGLIVPGGAGTPSVAQVVVEIYRVFPKDSDAGR